jgi:hypothetical protein
VTGRSVVLEGPAPTTERTSGDSLEESSTKGGIVVDAIEEIATVAGDRLLSGVIVERVGITEPPPRTDLGIV